MKDFLLVENTNNLDITTFNFSFTPTLSSYVAQALRIKLSFFLGEWFLNTQAGIPYFQSIFIKTPDLNLIEDVFKTEILSVKDVVELVSFELLSDTTTRALISNFIVRISDGSTVGVTV